MASNDMVEASAPRSLRKKQYGCKIDRQQRRPHLPPAIAQRRIPLYWRLMGFLWGSKFFSNPGEAMALQAAKDAVKDRT